MAAGPRPAVRGRLRAVRHDALSGCGVLYLGADAVGGTPAGRAAVDERQRIGCFVADRPPALDQGLVVACRQQRPLSDSGVDRSEAERVENRTCGQPSTRRPIRPTAVVSVSAVSSGRDESDGLGEPASTLAWELVVRRRCEQLADEPLQSPRGHGRRGQHGRSPASSDSRVGAGKSDQREKPSAAERRGERGRSRNVSCWLLDAHGDKVGRQSPGTRQGYPAIEDSRVRVIGARNSDKSVDRPSGPEMRCQEGRVPSWRSMVRSSRTAQRSPIWPPSNRYMAAKPLLYSPGAPRCP